MRYTRCMPRYTCHAIHATLYMPRYTPSFTPSYTPSYTPSHRPGIRVNCCCPGYCDTDMTSHRGPRSAHDGAQNAVTLATLPPSTLPSGAFFQDGKVSAW